jgi:quercetin dioxygenase-like cupin family protein
MPGGSAIGSEDVMRHSIIAAGQGLDYDWSNDRMVIKTAFEVTEGRVTLAEDTLKPGFHLARHHHRTMVEIFFILDGEVSFVFDDEAAVATPGTVVNVPPNVWHEVTCAAGGRLLTVFTPGGFDHYLAELAALDEQALADTALLDRLAERYDIWTS